MLRPARGLAFRPEVEAVKRARRLGEGEERAHVCFIWGRRGGEPAERGGGRCRVCSSVCAFLAVAVFTLGTRNSRAPLSLRAVLHSCGQPCMTGESVGKTEKSKEQKCAGGSEGRMRGGEKKESRDLRLKERMIVQREWDSAVASVVLSAVCSLHSFFSALFSILISRCPGMALHHDRVLSGLKAVDTTCPSLDLLQTADLRLSKFYFDL